MMFSGKKLGYERTRWECINDCFTGLGEVLWYTISSCNVWFYVNLTQARVTWEEGLSIVKITSIRSACRQVCNAVSSFIDRCGRDLISGGGNASEQVFLDGIRKQLSKPKAHKPVISALPWPLLQLLPSGSCSDFPEWWTTGWMIK